MLPEYGGAHVQTSIGVDASGVSDILQEGKNARLVRVTHVPHQVLVSDVSAVKSEEASCILIPATVSLILHFVYV